MAPAPGTQGALLEHPLKLNPKVALGFPPTSSFHTQSPVGCKRLKGERTASLPLSPASQPALA